LKAAVGGFQYLKAGLTHLLSPWTELRDVSDGGPMLCDSTRG
jgi:hypothetical protein